MRQRPLFVAVLAAALSVSACASGERVASRAVRTDSAGVVIVVNESADRPLGWRFEERFAVGGAEEGEEAFHSLWAPGIGVDSLDRLYVLDASSHRVVVFDGEGALLRTQGAKGGGPGEMEHPAFLVVHPAGEVGVFDYARAGLVRFAADGSTLPAERLVGEGGGRLPDGIRATTHGLVLMHTEYGDATRRSRLVARRDSGEVEIAATVERPVPAMHMYRSCGGRLGMSLPPLLEPSLAWTTSGGRIAAATGAGYVIDVHEGGRRVLSVRRTVPPVPVTPEMARREVGDGLPVRYGGGQCTVAPDEVIEVRGHAPALPAVRSIAIAPDSTIWVERGRVKDDPAVVDVFSAGGEYLGTLPPGSPVPVAFMRNGDVVAITTDELDVQRVVAYRVLRDGDAGRAGR